MQHYRLYFLDAAHRIEKYEAIEAPGDDDAVKLAASWAGRQRLELWQQARIVRTFEQTKQF